jgi:RNA polymerase sigma-70 factor (ECF subfamily)
MTEASEDLDQLGGDIKRAWHGFLDAFEPLRPELYRYSRYLTRSPWDAEDLVQDTLARGFVTLGTRFQALPNPRAWLFRLASNLWIDRSRRQRRGRELLAEYPATADEIADAREQREAAGTLLVELAPQERAAIVLKDVFDFSLEEIATALSTSVGAVKAALHRGRGKLVEPPEEPKRALASGVLDAFCAAFNAHDISALTALLLDDAVTEIVGVVTEYGADEPADSRTGSFANSLTPIVRTDEGGVDERFLVGYLGGSPRCEVREHRGELVLLFWFEHVDGACVRALWTVETAGDRIAHIRNYFFATDVIVEVCRELAVPFRVNGYRFW